MSHIDDGALHAYLDGALDVYSADEAEGIRDHLASCAECARRLDEERAVRAEAERILGTAAPEVEMPPFEELRAEARRRSRTEAAKGLSRVNRWAWAASVVLALGTGWMLRGSIGGWISRPSVQEEMARPSVSTPQADDAAGSAEAVPAPPTEEASAAGARDFREEAAGPPADQDAVKAAPGTTEEGAPPEEPLTTAEVEAVTFETAPATGADAGPPPPPTEDPTAAARLRERLPALEDFARQPALREGGAPAREGEPSEMDVDLLAVPGAAVLEVGRLEGFPPPGAIRLLQLTEAGDTLEVFHLPPGSDPATVPRRLDDDRAEVRRRETDGWIVLRGRLSEDVLRGYAALLAGGGDGG